jgi:hypothetical protein
LASFRAPEFHQQLQQCQSNWTQDPTQSNYTKSSQQHWLMPASISLSARANFLEAGYHLGELYHHHHQLASSKQVPVGPHP